MSSASIASSAFCLLFCVYSKLIPFFAIFDIRSSNILSIILLFLITGETVCRLLFNYDCLMMFLDARVCVSAPVASAAAVARGVGTCEGRDEKFSTAAELFV